MEDLHRPPTPPPPPPPAAAAARPSPPATTTATTPLGSPPPQKVCCHVPEIVTATITVINNFHQTAKKECQRVRACLSIGCLCHFGGFTQS